MEKELAMKRTGLVVMLCVLLAGAIPVHAASLVNRGFEYGGGSLYGWNVDTGSGSGSVAAVQAYTSWTAAEGKYFARLRTDTGDASNEYTALSQEVELSEGGWFSFKYFFEDIAQTFEAEASMQLLGQNGTPDVSLLTLNGNTDNTPAGQWDTVRLDPVAETGTYLIKIRIRDGGTRTVLGTMGVDDFRVSGIMPEPMTMIAGVMGLTGIAGYLRRRLRT